MTPAPLAIHRYFAAAGRVRTVWSSTAWLATRGRTCTCTTRRPAAEPMVPSQLELF